MPSRMAVVLVGLAALGWGAFAGQKVAEPAAGADDVADVASARLQAGGDPNRSYFLIGPRKNAVAPEDGYSLLLVMPGGDGGEGFHPFVKRIFKNALGDDYLVAQLIAVKWTPEQVIVWPTRENPVPGQKFPTESFVKAVIKDVAGKHKLNVRRVFTLSWSSGGPAAYAVSLQKLTPVTGSFIAMSVFKPQTLPALNTANGRAFFLYHSPDDRLCPFGMAQDAADALKRNGAAVELVTYEGGHGWRGDVYGNIRRGVKWLQNPPKPTPAPAAADRPSESGSTLMTDGFESGQQWPDGWRQGPAVAGVQYVWDRGVAFEGKASLCLKKTAQRFIPIAQWYRTEPHRGTADRLRVSAQVKAEKAAKAVIDVQFADAQGNSSHKWAAYIGAKESGDPPADHGWKEYAGTVSIPAGTKHIRLALQIYGPGTVWFDQLSVEYVME